MVRSAPRVFDKIKDSISNEITLTYFDPMKETILQVDAFRKGLGAALTQDRKPVAFASKAVTDVESRYANIERELLAVVYGCEKFHTYLYGRSFTVHTDHKLFESIHLKHLTATPPRLQRMLQRLQPYDLTIRYQPGKDMEVADALSRLSPESQDPIPGMNVQMHEIFPQFRTEQLGSGAQCTERNDPRRLAGTQPASPNTLKAVLALPGRASHRRRNSHESPLYYHYRHAAERDFDETTRTTPRNRENQANSLNLSLLERLLQGHRRNHKNMQYMWGAPA